MKFLTCSKKFPFCLKKFNVEDSELGVLTKYNFFSRNSGLWLNREG